MNSIAIKVLPSGKSLNLTFSDREVSTVGSMKVGIFRRFRVRPCVQKILYRGREIMDHENIDFFTDKDALSLVVCPYVKNMDFVGEDFDWEIRNIHSVMKAHPKQCVSRNTNFPLISLFSDTILAAGKYGPLSKILCFIDFLELLYSMIYVNRTFYEVSIDLLSSDNEGVNVDLNKTHLHVLFSTTYSPTTERLFITMLEILQKRNPENPNILREIRIHNDIPQHSFFERPPKEDTLLRASVSRNFFEATRLLVRKGLYLTSYILKKLQKRLKMLKFCIAHSAGKFEVSRCLFNHLMKLESWDLIFEILRKSQITPWNENYVYNSLFSAFTNNKNKKKMIKYSTFRQLEKLRTFSVEKNQYEIVPALCRMDEELLFHIFCLSVAERSHYVASEIIPLLLTGSFSDF